jgi:hypothetical protein
MRHKCTLLLISTGIITLLLTACGSPQPAPTHTLIPTDIPLSTEPPTPLPTETPLPTPTPTSVPTSTVTPDFAATAAVEATEAMAVIIEEIDAELQTIGYSTDIGSLAWVSEGPAEINITSYNTHDWLTLSSGQSFSDFILKADVTWESTSGLAVCGFWFRARSDDEDAEHFKFVTIRLSGLPMWDVEYWKYNEWRSTVSSGGRPSTSPHINQEQGSTNTYILAAEGNGLTVFANGYRIGQATILKLRKGLITFYALQESGETTCTFDNAWLWDLSE